MTLRAGFASVDITPGRELSLMGYDFRATDLPPGNAGVHDRLRARALALDDGERRAVLVSLDLCVIPNDLARALRARIAEYLQADRSRVILSATHTHSGPFAMTRKMAAARGWMETEDGVPPPEVAYGDELEAAVLEACARAAGLTFPVELRCQEAPLGLAYNRRVTTGEGVAHAWGPQEYPDLAPAVAPDPTCSVVVLAQKGGPRRYVIWGLGAHPVVLGQTSRVVSADYPGLACRLIEDQLPGSHALFLLGAAGDTHPWIATQEDPAYLMPVARTAASFVSLLTHATRPVSLQDGLRAASQTVTIGEKELDLVVWRLNRLWVVAMPVELFGNLGRKIRERLDGCVLLSTLSNGWNGYWPTSAAFDEGGYEVDNARRAISQGDGERLVETVLALAETIA